MREWGSERSSEGTTGKRETGKREISQCQPNNQ